MYCEHSLLLIVLWIAWGIFWIKVKATGFGVITLLVAVGYYIISDINEFKEGHIVHGSLGAIPIIVFIMLVLVVCVKEFIGAKIRKSEIPLIPERVEKYISMHGYTPAQDFIKYSNENSEFRKARIVKYTNPLYTKQLEENNIREKNKQKPLKITEPSQISYGQFASFKYKEIVLTYFMKELCEVIKNIYMFDYADIFAHMPDYSNFFVNDMLTNTHSIKTQPEYHVVYFDDISSPKVHELSDKKGESDIYDQLIQKYERIDKVYFQQACADVIIQLIYDGIIVRVSNNLFKSMIIPESEGNVVEGETIEISFDE